VEVFQGLDVFFQDSANGMTGGSLTSATGEREPDTGSGREGRWAVGRFSGQAGLLPRGLFLIFLFSFPFLFCFSFEFWFEIFCKTSELFQTSFCKKVNFLSVI
jgi:hypothetical protein